MKFFFPVSFPSFLTYLYKKEIYSFIRMTGVYVSHAEQESHYEEDSKRTPKRFDWISKIQRKRRNIGGEE